SFKAESVVIGGSIALAHDLFLPTFKSVLQKYHAAIPVFIAEDTEVSAITGAALFLEKKTMNNKPAQGQWRKTLQPLLDPAIVNKQGEEGSYDLYPTTLIGNGDIFEGYRSLAKWMANHKQVIIDGFAGNDWPLIMENLHEAFRMEGLNVWWIE